MDQTVILLLLAELLAAAIGFWTAWAMRGREVRRAREALEYMRALWARVEQAPAVSVALRSRQAVPDSPMKLLRAGAHHKRASA